MGDPTSSGQSQPPWWVNALQWIEDFIKRNWSGLAVLLYDYEQKKLDAAQQQTKDAELKEKLAEDENAIRKDAASKSSADIIRESLSSKPDKS